MYIIVQFFVERNQNGADSYFLGGSIFFLAETHKQKSFVETNQNGADHLLIRGT
jgi:hypothetical protein